MSFVRFAIQPHARRTLIQVHSRSASVLASMPPRPKQIPQPSYHDLPHIVTPASLPLTAPSNNAFHPAHIPKKAKARLALAELNKVLDTSRDLLNHLQSEYLEYQNLQETIVSLTKKQQALLRALATSPVADIDNDSEK